MLLQFSKLICLSRNTNSEAHMVSCNMLQVASIKPLILQIDTFCNFLTFFMSQKRYCCQIFQESINLLHFRLRFVGNDNLLKICVLRDKKYFHVFHSRVLILHSMNIQGVTTTMVQP